MKAVVSFAFLFLIATAHVVADAPSLGDFTTVTNLWYEGHKSNVLAIAEQRLAANSNDLAGAIMMFDYDLEFSNEGNYSNDVRRILSSTNNLPIGTFVNNIDLITSTLNGFLDYLSSNPMTPVEIQKSPRRLSFINQCQMRFFYSGSMTMDCFD